jgi:alpha-beta hydrolase superfamily lysophospholipase
MLYFSNIGKRSPLKGGQDMADVSTSATATGKSPRRRLRRWSIRVGLVVTLWLAVSWVVAYRLTRRPRPMFAEPVPVVAWAKIDEHRLRTRDGEQIGAWSIAGRDDAPSVLLIHGNGGSRWNCLGRAELLAAKGYPVLMISLRAHGDSTGEHNDFGLGARHDVIAAVEFLEAARPGRPIVIMGTSMGGAAALFASRELGHRIGGYILESPYRDLKTAVWNRTDEALPIVLEWIAYRGLVTVAPLVLPEIERISPLVAIEGIPEDVPVLILAGEDDRSARVAEARALFDRARSHADLLIFPDAGHLQMMERDPGRYRDAVIGLIGRSGRR